MQQKRYGFTLIELLVVVAIVGALAALTVGIYSSVERSSAEKISVANQQSIFRNVQSFLSSVNRGRLDKLDALIDVSTPGGAPGTFAGLPSQMDVDGNASLNSALAPVGGVYRGTKLKKWGGAAADTADRANNDGLHSGLYKKVSVYYLSAANVQALKDGIGLTQIWYHNPTADRAYNVSVQTGIGNCDGTPVNNGEGAPGFRVEFTAAFLTKITNNIAVLAVDPLKGSQIYGDLGQPLFYTDPSTGEKRLPANDTEAQAAMQASGGVILLFGLGDEATIVGNSNCGMSRAPRCETLGRQYYRQYLLAVRMRAAGPVWQPAEVVGVIDPKGQSVRQADFYTHWRTTN